jgi:cell wall-associated NlpC family hydrolase
MMKATLIFIILVSQNISQLTINDYDTHENKCLYMENPKIYTTLNTGLIEMKSLEKNDTKHTTRTVNPDSLISDAKGLLGSPYVWGGTTPEGFDSSGFIHYVFKQNGITISRTHREYWNEGESVSVPEPGDVVFFETYQPGPSHAGIYIGNNEFIHNSSSKGVIITSMDNPYWKPRYIGAKRYFLP